MAMVIMLEGTDGDAFPNNSDQWTDSDGDGFGDNANGLEGDKFKIRGVSMVSILTKTDTEIIQMGYHSRCLPNCEWFFESRSLWLS